MSEPAAITKCALCPVHYMTNGHKHCATCSELRRTIGGIKHRMQQQPSASYIFVPRDWLTTLLTSHPLNKLAIDL